jgi:hypothetical protein
MPFRYCQPEGDPDPPPSPPNPLLPQSPPSLPHRLSPAKRRPCSAWSRGMCRSAEGVTSPSILLYASASTRAPSAAYRCSQGATPSRFRQGQHLATLANPTTRAFDAGGAVTASHPGRSDQGTHAGHICGRGAECWRCWVKEGAKARLGSAACFQAAAQAAPSGRQCRQAAKLLPGPGQVNYSSQPATTDGIRSSERIRRLARTL